MPDYSIAAVTRRAVYTGSAGTGPYAFSFACLATSDIAVFKNETKLTETSDYTVTLSSSTGTGSVTLGSAASGSDTITLVGARALARTTDFVTSGSLTASALNTDFDSLVIFAQQLSEENSRNLKAPVTEGISGTTDMTIPAKATRASKILEFDSDGNPAVSLTATNLSTLAGITDNINTVAGISANVTTVAGISANVTTVAGKASEITSVAAKASLITSDFVSDLNTLATSAIVTDLDILGTADVVADLATLATSDIVADINTLATSDIVSDLNTLATSAIVADLNILATSDNVTNMATLGASGVVSNIASVAGSIANVNTTATNIAGVNSFAARYRVASSDPGSDNDAGDLVFNTTSNILKVFNGSSFDDITGSTLAGLSDTNITSPADGSILLYDTGTSKYIDNVISGDATLADTGALTIADDAITSAKIADDAVTTALIADDAITSALIADDAINSEHYTDGSIDTAHIGDAQVTLAKLAADAIPTPPRPNAQPLIINGDMAISQRGTSFTGQTGSVYTLDRMYVRLSGAGTWTITQDTDVPTGNGFGKSLKMDCTTANSSLDASDFIFVNMRFEKQDMQVIKKGTSSAEIVTVCAWVKSPKTGVHVVGFYDANSSTNRYCMQTYSISSANTWQKITVNFPADTGGDVMGTDNTHGMNLQFWFAAGSNFTSGSAATVWENHTAANQAVGQVNCSDSTDNNIFITGIQMEIGSYTSATIPPFQHESFGDSLARCQRYCTAITKESNYAPVMLAHGVSANSCRGAYFFRTPMRSAPSFTATGDFIRSFEAATSLSSATAVSSRFSHSIDWTGSGLFGANEGILITFNTGAASLIYDAEL
tara:strand:+ start:2546 stop:5068 length:2523 start_codon:yes stop_codon:yes gene_type:complete